MAVSEVLNCLQNDGQSEHHSSRHLFGFWGVYKQYTGHLLVLTLVPFPVLDRTDCTHEMRVCEVHVSEGVLPD